MALSGIPASLVATMLIDHFDHPEQCPLTYVWRQWE